MIIKYLVLGISLVCAVAVMIYYLKSERSDNYYPDIKDL